MEAVRVLATEIGARPPCSGAEARAARWCAGHLGEQGIHVELETFPSRPSARPWIAAYLAVAATGAVLAVPVPLLAFVLGTAALVLYARDVDGRPLVSPRGGDSVNVLARRGVGAPELVVVAQLDSARTSVASSPRFGPGRRGWTIVVHTALVLVPVMGAAAWVAEAGRPLPTSLWAVSVGVAIPLLAAVAIELHAEKAMPLTPGANDGASAVEVVMRLSRRFEDERVWWLLTGSGTAGNLGMQAFLDVHERDLGRARILNVLPVGRGAISAAPDEGLLRLRRADGALLDAATEAGAEARAYRTTQSAAAVAIAHHHRAASIVALDEHGAVPHQGWITDTLANVDASTIDAAEDLVARVIVVATGASDRGPSRRGRIGGATQA